MEASGIVLTVLTSVGRTEVSDVMSEPQSDVLMRSCSRDEALATVCSIIRMIVEKGWHKVQNT